MFELENETSPLSRFQLEHQRILHKKHILNILEFLRSFAELFSAFSRALEPEPAFPMS